MQPAIAVSNLTKTYATGFEALKGINLEIRPGEIFAGRTEPARPLSLTSSVASFARRAAAS
jgi:ABC-type phosphonate transport system ATPase subunit